MKILIAVDGSDYSNAAVDAIAMRPWPEGSVVGFISASELTLVATPDSWNIPPSYYTEVQDAGIRRAEENVRNARHRFMAENVGRVQTITMTGIGHPREVILDEAEKWGADLIVLGSHGYHGLKRFLLGSVSQAVATHASCSVEIIRKKAEAS